MCSWRSSILHYGPLLETYYLYAPTPNGQSPSASLNKSNTLPPVSFIFLGGSDSPKHTCYCLGLSHKLSIKESLRYRFATSQKILVYKLTKFLRTLYIRIQCKFAIGCQVTQPHTNTVEKMMGLIFIFTLIFSGAFEDKHFFK